MLLFLNVARSVRDFPWWLFVGGGWVISQFLFEYTIYSKVATKNESHIPVANVWSTYSRRKINYEVPISW